MSPRAIAARVATPETALIVATGVLKPMLKPLRRAQVELRSAPRKAAKASATLIVGGCASLPCVLQDISATGAKVAISRSVFLPREFSFEVPSMNLKERARLTWRNRDQAGIRFQSR